MKITNRGIRILDEKHTPTKLTMRGLHTAMIEKKEKNLTRKIGISWYFLIKSLSTMIG
jgi:hypothetical protein